MRIQVLTGADAGAASEVEGDLYVIGRDPSCNLALSDPDVGERHAALERLPSGRYALHDLRSRKGTYVNGRRIKAAVPLDGTETIRLAQTTLQVAPSRPKSRRAPSRRPSSRRLWVAVAGIAAVVALAAGLGVVLTRGGAEVVADGPEESPPVPTEAQLPATTETSAGSAAVAPPQGQAGGGAGVIAFERLEAAEPRVVLVNPDGTGAAALDAGSGGESDPALSPDGSLVAFLGAEGDGPFTGGSDSRLMVASRDGGAANPILDAARGGAIVSGPTWSPDGTRLAVGVQAGGIVIVGRDGRSRRSLGSGRIEAASWSPDGSRIALAARVGRKTVVVATVRPDGSDPTPLVNVQALPEAIPAGLDWSPDGRRIALTCTTGRGAAARPAICVIRPNGKKLEVLAGGTAASFDPSWSPRGGRIAFVSNRSGNDEIYVMNADGSHPVRVTSDPAPDRHPSWGQGARLPVPEAAAPVAFRDDFSDTSSGWEVFRSADGGSARYADGGLVISMPKAGFIATSDSGRSLETADVAVAALPFAGGKTMSFGIVCGYRDQSRFYLLGIRSDGSAGILRWRNRRETVLTPGGLWERSAAIPPGARRYDLSARCSPSRLALSVNGREVARADVSGAAGTFGLFVETYGKGGARVRFDDVVVTEPDPPS